ncbi:hypothetical protein MVEN_02149300 [Mycena venus]|uniref:Uncharacterized protein n=1 Tax=Mycena venus TaxID=2733690 RepID=A0A8H6XAM0_9AGAR|nr:hypothetical protein MVEN_02149300 [Mycena venus]
MEAKIRTMPDDSSTQSNPAVFRGTCNAAISNSSARDLIMSDCTTNVTFTTVPAEPSDFRRIPLGDIDLRHEIQLYKPSGVVYRQSGRRSIHSAKIDHRSVTVALYHGDGAEEEWRDDIMNYMSFRRVNPFHVPSC